MILYIIRHAWADHADNSAWPDDRQRPLSDEGRARFGKLVSKLIHRGFAPGIIATSPLLRCRQTAELVSDGVAGKPRVIERDELQPSSDLGGILRWTAQQVPRYDQVAWVGHAPDVGHMTAHLVGSGEDGVDFAKGAVAAILFDEVPEIGVGELRWLVTAKILGC